MMAIVRFLQRWIEVLTALYLTYSESLSARRAVMISWEGDHFAARRVKPRVGADANSADPNELDEDAILAEWKPHKRVPGKVSRAIEGGLVIVELPNSEVVVRRISVPAQAREFLAGIVSNQIDRLSPWQSEQAAYGFDAERNSEDPATLDVRVLIASRAAIDGAREKLGSMGLTIDRVVTRQSHAETTRFITLWSRLAALSREDLDRARWRVAASIAAAVLLGLAVSLYAVISAASLRAETDDDEARTKVLLRQIEGGDSQSLASLKPSERAWREKETSPTAAIVIEAVSRALPDAAYLTELHLEGVTLRMIGLTRDPPSLIAPLEQSGHLADVHFFAPTTREPDGSQFRFHVEARVKPRYTLAAEAP
jgi:general secretion pathway protein L